MKVRVFCYRGPNYYGFGLTPEQAVDSAVKAGMSRKLMTKGTMHRLPEGVTDVEVNEMGTLCWNGSDERPWCTTTARPPRSGAPLPDPSR